MKNFNEADFLDDLRHAPFYVCENSPDVDDSFWTYENILLNLIDKHAPLKSKCIQGNQAPYMNSALRKAINQRNMWRNKHFSNRSDNELRQQYRKWRNKVVKLRKESIRNYIDKKCNHPVSSRDFYRILKPFFSEKNSCSNNIILCENENIINDPSEVADVFNAYYASIAEYPAWGT